jgi:hypothetical protein
MNRIGSLVCAYAATMIICLATYAVVSYVFLVSTDSNDLWLLFVVWSLAFWLGRGLRFRDYGGDYGDRRNNP